MNSWTWRKNSPPLYQPATPAEQDLVDEMVAIRWRINRIRTIETVIMDCEMVRKKAEIEKTFLQPDSGIHMGMAFRTLAEESRSLSLCNRYESRFSRMFDRAYRTLRELQKQAGEPRKQKAEPEPPEPPKPNGSIQIATAPEGAQPSEPETNNEETNPSPTPGTVARALLRAVSRLFATPLASARALANKQLEHGTLEQPSPSFLGWGALPTQLHSKQTVLFDKIRAAYAALAHLLVSKAKPDMLWSSPASSGSEVLKI